MEKFNLYKDDDILNIEIDDMIEFELIDYDPEDILNTPIFEDHLKGGFKGIKLAAYDNEGNNIPHFHYYKDCDIQKGIPESKLKFGGCLCIMDDKYFLHDNHIETLNSREIKHLKKFLRERCNPNKKYTDFTGESNWEYIIFIWNKNSENKVPEDQEIPDYKSTMENKINTRSLM